ncbi:hypothetical protein ACA910_021142 [Epithemia clementina (nom. ined.)]
MNRNGDELKKATRLGAASVGFLFLATTLTIPYLQSRRDELGCDAVCYGSITSTRSILNLIGAALVGRLSDLGGGNNGGSNSRQLCLLVGVVAGSISLVAANRAKTMMELWCSLFPGMLQQNMSVMNALFSDYHSMYDDDNKDHENGRDDQNSSGSRSSISSRTDRASSAGMLGMVTGLAFMVGPMVGSMFLSSYDQATAFALLLLLLSAICTGVLPRVDSNKGKQVDKQKTEHIKKSFLSFLNVPSARSPAAIFILTNRLLMSLSDHVFTVVGPSSLKQRFQFGPKQYGMFFSMVGLFYALAQGFAAKIALKRFGGNTSKGRSRLLVICAIAVAVGRYWAFYSSNLALVYVFYALLVTAIGISATITNADATRIPAANEVGSFFGIMGAVESGAGVIGPLLASGLVSSLHLTAAPLYAAVFLNMASALLFMFAYDKCVIHQSEKNQQKDPVHKKLE